jgi:hypothetical protein
MHLVIGTPMYGGMCCSEYTQSLLQLQSDMERNGHKMTCVFLGNESLIQRARNTVAHHFLQTDASHLLFIDADQKFRPADIVKMIQADKGIIAGCVPMKGINWKRVKQGAVLNHPNLAALTGIFNINELDGHKMTNPEVPFEVKHAGTGFMLIKREVFEELKPHAAVYTNGGQSIPDGEEVHDYFPVGVVDGKLLSEDFNFCHLYREHGGSVWAAPWCELGHFGSYLFSGQYSKGA